MTMHHTHTAYALILLLVTLCTTPVLAQDAEPTSELETLIAAIQADPAGATEAQVLKMLGLTAEQGQAYAASVAVKGYLSFHVKPSSELLFAAALTAERAGDFRGAVARYKALLGTDGEDAKHAEAAGRLYTLLVEVLELSDDAYGVMRRHIGKFRKHSPATRYDGWFLDQAQKRRDHEASVKLLVAAFGEKMPIELERLHYWRYLDGTLSELTQARKEQAAAAAPLRKLVPLIRDDAERKAFAAFVHANLAFHAGSAGKDPKVLAAEYGKVISAAKAYFDADPTAGTAKDVYTVLYGGRGHWQHDRVKPLLPQITGFLEHAFPKLSAEQRNKLLAWTRDGWKSHTPIMATGSGWTRVALADPAFFKQSPYASRVPFDTTFDKLEGYTKSAAFTDGVRSYRAAIINSMAAAQGQPDAAKAWDAVMTRFETVEMRHLGHGQPHRMINDLWNRFKALPVAKGVKNEVYEKRYLAFARKTLIKSPVVMHDRDALRYYAIYAWRHAGSDKNRKAVIADLQAMRWVPMDDKTRKHVFGSANNEYRNWANGVRKRAKDKKNPAPKEMIDAVAPIDEAFRAVMGKNGTDTSKAPNDLTRSAAEAFLAVRNRDSATYVTTGRAAYDTLKKQGVAKTTGGEATLRWLVAEHDRINSTDLQVIILKDSITGWKPNTDDALATHVLHQVTSKRRDWSWGRIPKNQKDRAKKVNDVLAAELLKQIDRGEVWPSLFSEFRKTRSGRDWKEHGWNQQVLARMIETKALEKMSYRPSSSIRSGTVSAMWLVRAEFPGLQKKYPIESAFDDAFIAEAKRTQFLDYRYWEYGRDKNGKVAAAAADLLKGFERLPLGYGSGDGPKYNLNELMDWHGKALAAKPEQRDAMLSAITARYGKTRFDQYALGRAWFVTHGKTNTEAARKEFFTRLAAVLEKGAAQPARVGTPRLNGLEKIETKSLTNEELDVLVSIFETSLPSWWSGGWGYERLGSLVHNGMRARGRSAELALIAPHLWAIARDTRNGNFTRELVGHTKKLAQDKTPLGQELALVYASAGLEVQRNGLPEDARTALSSLRNQGLAEVAAVIPVKRTDPRYPIYSAQAAYLSGREQAAWETYLEHQALLPTVLKELDPGFTVWLVQQHTNVAQYETAEALARDLLVWFDASSDTLDPELRGGLMLAYADIALARDDHARARALYERIASAADYEGTRVRNRALLQVADVDRITGRYDEAIDALEKLSRKDDTDLQTEAFYYLARVRFDQDQPREAMSNLEKVFARQSEHPDARILEGKVRIALKDIETPTEIPFGSVTLQRRIVPGKPLKVSLQDPNLAVVGTSADIEIRAWTDSGDEELFSLLPFGDSKTKFRGEIGTELGATTPDDGVLQVLGEDKVYYDFSDRFKRANNITFGRPLGLTVASDAELYASSGRILTREEIEQQKLETIVMQRIGQSLPKKEKEEVALSTVRAGHQVKPGNPINVRVIDPDRSGTPGVDELPVRVSARSGDVIGAYILKETGTHTGVFEGAVPTTAGQPTAYASDSADGSEPNFAIAPGDYPAWSGLADGVKPKTFTIDLNDNVAPKTMRIVADVPGQKIKAFTLQRSFNANEFTTIGQYPKPYQPWDGTLRREITPAPSLPGDALSAKTLSDYLTRGRTADTQTPVIQPVKSLAGKIGEAELKGVKLKEDGVFLAHYRGAFVQDRRQVRKLKLVDTNPGAGAAMILRVNQGERVKGEVTDNSYQASMDRGVHQVDIFIAAKNGTNPSFELQWDVPEPPYMAAAPGGPFDAKANPEIREAVFIPPAAIKLEGDTFTVAFDESTQARVLRMVITDFEGGAPAISSVTLDDRTGNQVLPTAEDFLALRKNQTLEIVPGDLLTVQYNDPVVNTAGKEEHRASLTATYANGSINAAFAKYKLNNDGTRDESYIPMRRFKAGDVVHVIINDPDLDTSAEPDKVAFTASSAGGTLSKLTAIETEPHSGIFVGKVFPVENEPTRDGEVRVTGSDLITLQYTDQENTDPGIPWLRTAEVEQAVYSTPVMRVFDVTSRPLDAQELAAFAPTEEELAGDSVTGEESVPPRMALTAVRPEEVAEGPSAAVIGAPVFVEVMFPFVAQSPESSIEVFAQAGSARPDVAPAEPAEGEPAPPPFDINVPGTVRLVTRPSSASEGGALPRGYSEMLVVGDRFAVSPLEDGRFTVNVPVVMGTTPTESFALPTLEDTEGTSERTLFVKGDDTIHLAFRYQDEQGVEQWLTAEAKLTSDAFFDVMDRRYQKPVEGLYVGQSAYLRVIHPSRNTTDEKDTLTVGVTTESGREMAVELTETFSHSGEFKGLVNLTYDGEEAVAEGTTLPVKYGDDVTLAYAPPADAEGKLSHRFDVFKGSDGSLLSFTKRYKDADTAVQTQFTIAEAHFELAKRYRDLKQEQDARASIRQGKKLLEEAVRDHPDTEARAQADYLLANLSIEFAKDAVNEDIERKHYLEAINRFSDIVASYPDSPYAPKAQYKKAQSYEKMGEIDKACDEYVKLSYRYPDHELVAETIARLGQFFLTKGKGIKAEADQLAKEGKRVEAETKRMQGRDMFKTAAEVFGRLAVRFPNHNLADKTTVLSAQCYMQAERYGDAVKTFEKVINNGDSDKALRAESMYWAGDSYARMAAAKTGDRDAMVKAYRMFKNLDWDFPETKWAKYARGRLTEEAFDKIDASGG